MDIKYTIEDNYLKEEDYKKLKNDIMARAFPWQFSTSVADLKEEKDPTPRDTFYFTHVFYLHGQGITSPCYNMLAPLLTKLKIKALIRIKANLYPNQGEIKEHDKHFDFEYPHKGAILSLNTCNGFTTLGDGTKIKSVGNSILFFDPSIPHHSSTCTDAPVRVNINFNYF